jgi:predicted NBD/HSP70 family sugar kinase
MTSTTTWDTLKKRLDSIQLPVATFTICEDPEVRQRLHRAKSDDQQARDQLAALTEDTDPQVKAMLKKTADDAAKELAEAQKAFDKGSVTLRFTALQRKDLEALQKQHPPTEEDEADGQDYAMAGFAPALISAASLDGMPVEDAQHFLDTWSTADATGLWRAAWSVQHQQRTDLGKG